MGEVVDLGEARASRGPNRQENDGEWSFSADFFSGGTDALVFRCTGWNETLDQPDAERLRTWADQMMNVAGILRSDAEVLENPEQAEPMFAMAMAFTDGHVRVRTYTDAFQHLTDEEIDKIGAEIANVMKGMRPTA